MVVILKKRSSRAGGRTMILPIIFSFLLGCILSAVVVLNLHVNSWGQPPALPFLTTSVASSELPLGNVVVPSQEVMQQQQHQQEQNPDVPAQPASYGSPTRSILDGVRILVAIAAFDFSQIPHLEEVLDGYFDLCASGAQVDVVIHATEAYPVALIDLLNSRFVCTNPSPRASFSIKIVLVSFTVALHLVDFHRPYFYERIDKYDLFLYTEDDIRISPRTIGTYLTETKRVQELVGIDQASNFNVGVVRYEYNFPPDIIINDKTRHATQNATRVYWEHAWKPAIPKSVSAVPQKELSQHYVHMINHHQGMFLATRDLLLAWKAKVGCEFDQVKNRPGMKNKPSQPSEGTQRVWMSSQQLYGNKHCGIQQLLPMDKFGAFNVLHLPNKNYRRVGRKGRLGGAAENGNLENEFPDGTEKFELPSDLLLTAMELHVQMRKMWPAKPQHTYMGITMVDEVKGQHRPTTKERMARYNEYVARGGVMSEEDTAKPSSNQ